MAVFKRGRVYWYHFTFNGTHVQRSTKQGNPRTARQIEAAAKTALAKGEVGIFERKPAPSFRVAIEEFLKWTETEHTQHPRTYRRYVTSSKALIRHFKDVALDRISTGDVESFKAKRTSEKGLRTRRVLRPATVNRELACLKAMFYYASKQEYVTRNPVRSEKRNSAAVKFLEEDNDHPRAISFDDQRRYLAEAAQPLRDVAVIMAESGMRPEEVFLMTDSNAHLNEGYVFNPFGKTKAARRNVQLSKVAVGVLRARLEAAIGPHLFASKKNPNEPIRSLQNAHAGALKRSGVRPFRIYDLRHTFATRALESGAWDLITLAAQLGHAHLDMVKRYAKPSDEHQARAMKRFEEFSVQQQIAAYEGGKGQPLHAAGIQ